MKPIIERIKKLLALAEKNPNQHEREVALGKAQQLMLAHRIAEDQLEEGEEREFIVSDLQCQGTPKGNKITYLLWVIDEAADVFSYFEKADRYNQGVRFVGHKEAVAFACYLYAWLNGEFDRQWAVFRQQERKARRVVNLAKRDHFFKGVSDALTERLADDRRDFEEQNAVVLVNEGKQAEVWFNRINPPLNKLELKGYKDQIGAYGAGWDAAENIRLNRPLEETSSKVRLLGDGG